MTGCSRGNEHGVLNDNLEVDAPALSALWLTQCPACVTVVVCEHTLWPCLLLLAVVILRVQNGN